jgi:excisionase family DNA binding protein
MDYRMRRRTQLAEEEVPMEEQRLLLKADEAAVMLAVSRACVYAMIRSGALPVVKLGRAVRVPTRELARWVEERAAGVGSLAGADR